MKRFPPLLSWCARLAAALLALLPCLCLEAQEPALAAPQTVTAPALFSRIVLLGASVTAGFDMSQPLGGPKALQYRFSHFVEAAITGAHEPVATQASSLLFLSAPETLAEKITATLAAKPSLVIGMDALFWFCYGANLSTEERLKRFEQGLKLLERIEVPLVLGDIPDASNAVGGILSKSEVPEPAVIAQCNAALKLWVAGRGNVTVFPLSKLMAVVAANEELTLGEARWEKGRSSTLLRSDKLHPSRQGLAALAIEVLKAAAAAAVPPLGAGSVVQDPERVYEAALARASKP